MHLNEGDKAPDIKAKDQNGSDFELSKLKGKKVILYFYPRDNTPGCTAEACDLRDNYTSLTNKGYEVVGVSNDDEKSHQKFINKFDLPFTLLADTDKKIVNDYGVYGEKKFMGKVFDGIHRTTFIIDEEGNIAKIIKKVKTKEASAQVLELMEA